MARQRGSVLRLAYVASADFAIARNRDTEPGRSKSHSTVAVLAGRLAAAVLGMCAVLGAVAGPRPQVIAQTVHFTASPTSGPAPLTVKFCASAGIVIDFGDGTRSGMQGARGGACPAGLSTYVLHTYTAPGTYHLRGFPCPSSMLNPECGEAAGQAAGVTVTHAP